MKILILSSEQFIPVHEPLAGTFQYDQSRILINAGYDVAVISVQLKFSLPMLLKAISCRFVGKKIENDTGKETMAGLFKLLYQKMFQPASFIIKEQISGINVYRAEGFYMTRPSDKKDYRYWLKAGMIGFEQYINDNGKPDILHAHNALYAGILAATIKTKYGIPFMLTEHSSYYSRKLYNENLLPKAQYVFEQAQVATTVSPFLAGCLQQMFSTAVQWKVLPNVAEPVFEEIPLLEKKRNDSFVFLHIANLIPLKRQALLIQAFHEAFEKNESVRLEFAGEGETLNELKQLVSSLDENKRISFLGLLSKEKIFEKLNEVQVVCLPSQYETFGVSLLEAILRGVPIIATSCGGPNEIVTPENGLLVNVDDKIALQHSLKKIKEEYSTYSATIIRNQAIEKYGAKKFLQKLNNYYSQLLNE